MRKAVLMLLALALALTCIPALAESNSESSALINLPQTGDSSNALIYAIAGIVALAGLVLIAKRKRI